MVRPAFARVTGGAAKSPVWLLILSDVLGLELCTINTHDGGALGGGVALVIVIGIERRDHTLIFLISIQFPLMSAGNFQDQLVNIHRNAIGELWQVPFTGKDQQESVLVQRNRIFRRTQVHGRILICTNFRLI